MSSPPIRFSLFVAPAQAPQPAVASPCVSVCEMDDASGLCRGCLRTLDEIAHWGLYDDDEKRAVLGQLAQRRAGGAVER